MDRSQAEALVAMLQAYFPRPELPPSTVAMWATELEHHDFADGQEAVRRVAREKSYPVLAETLEFLEAARRERLHREDPPLLALSPAEFMAVMPDEVRAKVVAMHERWAGEDEVARDYEAEKAEWKRKKAAVILGRRHPGVCSGAGKIAALLDEKLVCPACQVELEGGAELRRMAAERIAESKGGGRTQTKP